jgi:hypothetical protein
VKSAGTSTRNPPDPPDTSTRSIALYSVLEREKIRLSIGDRVRCIVPTDVHSLCIFEGGGLGSSGLRDRFR